MVVVVVVVVLLEPPVVLVGTGDNVVEVDGAVVDVDAVVPPQGVEPTTPTRFVMHSTNAPSAESIAAPSPVV